MPFEGYGNCVIIRHAYGLQTLYSHNVRNLVKEGDYVDVGQVVALTGLTGRATTEHLHFEVRVDGTHYDPGLLFDHETYQLKRHTLIFRKKGKVDIK
jgi:murein DD-endopeptidase MepM/ murein hydrolase activator NlpD